MISFGKWVTNPIGRAVPMQRAVDSVPSSAHGVNLSWLMSEESPSLAIPSGPDVTGGPTG